MSELLRNFSNKLFEQKPIDSIVFFRIAFGIILFYEVSRYLFSGVIKAMWIEPDLLFKYYGFYWVNPLPETFMYLLVAMVALASAFIAIGFLYRISTVVFFLGFTYMFLLEQAYYLNHYYLVVLMSFLLIFVPANRSFSLDAKLWPKIRSNYIPAWCVWLLMFQLGVVYFFSGIAKINMDWLLGEPIRLWLRNGKHFLDIQRNIDSEFLVYFISYGGLLFDLFIVPLLLIKKTRIYAFVLAIAFHLSNKLLFSIGIFPFLSISLTTLYFSPNWPRKILNLKTQLGNQIKPKTDLNKKVVVSLLALYIGFQILFPLRHFLYPGKVAWTEEGHKFSWRMKLRDKHGTISYKITDPKTNKTWNLEPDFYLTKRQLRKLSTRPNLMLQFSHFMEDQFTKKGIKNVEVRTRARVSLNGREKQLIINPKADLAKQKESLLPAKWILPLNKQLKHK